MSQSRMGWEQPALLDGAHVTRNLWPRMTRNKGNYFLISSNHALVCSALEIDGVSRAGGRVFDQSVWRLRCRFDTIKIHSTLISFPRIFNTHFTLAKGHGLTGVRTQDSGLVVQASSERQQSGSPLDGRVYFYASFKHFMQFLNINFP